MSTVNSTPIESTRLLQLSFRLKDSKVVESLQGTSIEIEEFLSDMEGFSIGGINKSLENFRPKALNPFRGIKKLPSSVIDWKEIYPVQEKIEYENKSKLPTEIPIKHTGQKIVKGISKIYPPLVLNTHTAGVCSETGIPLAFEIASPIGTTFNFPHPFSRYENVNEFLRMYQKHGKPLGKLSNEELAGMLITILKHKGFTDHIKSGLQANHSLSAGNKAVLIRALNYFYHLPSSLGLPKINLEMEGDIDYRLLQYMQVCRGEDTTLQVHYMQERRNTHVVKLKVFQTIAEQEKSTHRKGIDTAKVLLDKLKEDKPQIKDKIFKTFAKEIDSSIFATIDHKNAVCWNLEVVFGPCKEVTALQDIITNAKSEYIERDLLAVTDSIDKEIGTNQVTEKLSLTELLAKQKGKG